MEERLRKFAKVAEVKSFTRAAGELHTSQPALSVAIAKLERELGASLINRETLQLTTAGHLAYEHAQKLDLQRSNLRHQLQILKSQKPQFALGIIDSLADALLVSNGQLADIEQQVRLTLSVNNSRYLLDALGNNSLDIALIVQPHELPRKLASQKLGSEPLLGVTAASLKHSVQHNIRRGQLADFLAYDQSSHTHRLIQQYFASRQVNLQNVFQSTSPEIILHMVLAGRGSAVLPYALVSKHIESGKLSPITSVVDRQIVAIWQKGKTLPVVADVLLQTAIKLLDKQNRGAKRLTVL